VKIGKRIEHFNTKRRTMSTTKHTPGPWEFDKDNVGVNRTTGYGILNSEGTIGVTVHLKHLRFMTPDELIENAEANARLISAAPELLTELEADEDASQLSFAQFFKKHGYNVTERGDRRRAAIAKAKGEHE